MVLLGHVDGKPFRSETTLLPGTATVVWGGQRIQVLISQYAAFLDGRIDEAGLDREAYWWYRDLRRYGTVPHAGFGLGFERTVAYVTGMANVRDVIPFPRTPRNADF